MSLKLQELPYIQYMFYIIHNQQLFYMRALPDVLTYLTAAHSSATYIEPYMNVERNILYPQLFEELKSVLIH
jgi:hypothetical protein